MDFWKFHNARRRPQPLRASDHTLLINPEPRVEDVMVYRDAQGRPRVAILDHSRVG